MYEQELYHHGIRGQKWGVRRYQNPDGTLTEAGQKRYFKYYSKDPSNGTLTPAGAKALGKQLQRNLSDERLRQYQKADYDQEKAYNDWYDYKGSYKQYTKAYNRFYKMTLEDAKKVGLFDGKHMEAARGAVENYISGIRNAKSVDRYLKKQTKAIPKEVADNEKQIKKRRVQS